MGWIIPNPAERQTTMLRGNGNLVRKIGPMVLSLAILTALCFHAQAQDTVDATTLTGKYMCGYQGWFECPGDGSGGGWFHWFNSQTPIHANLNTDVFPDFTEYADSELFATQMHYSDGSVVKVNSSYRSTTEMRHFRWMKENNIDGVWVQRFGPKHVGWNDFTNKVLLNCKQAAEANGRVFVVMYDVSGANNSTLFNDMTTDWMYLVDTFKVTQSPRYLKHKGKPLVSIWGFGFADRTITADVATQLVQWFKTGAPAKYQATVMAGVISSGGVNWRTIGDPWISAIETADIISPWFVGSFGDSAGADGFKTSRIIPDLTLCQSLGKDYLPVVWPGFSWSNMHQGTTPQNQIPRLGGRFYWEQIYNAVSAGCTMLYGAMFDEIDEGTAILKGCPKKSLAPSDGWWLTWDADGYNLPSNWYLQVAGWGNKMLKKQIPLSKTMPINPNQPDTGLVVSCKPFSSPRQQINGLQVRRGMVFLSASIPGNVVLTAYQASGRFLSEIVIPAMERSKGIPLSTLGIGSDGMYLLRLKIGGAVAESRSLAFVR
jgi:hypothetical protein